MYKNKHTKNTKKIVKAVMVLVPMLLVGASLLMAPIDVQALNEILVTFEHCPPDCGSWPAPPGGGSSGDSSSNTLTQTNDQSASPGLPDLFDITDMLNTGINDADFDNSNFNDVTQSNVQTIDDAGDRSLAANTGINGAELSNSNDNDISQANDQDMEDIDEGSSAENDAENNAELDDSDDNDVDQSNNQEIKDVSDGSQAANIGLSEAIISKSSDK